MTTAPALTRIPVGVVVERRKAASPWIDMMWRPVGVLAGVPDAAPWTMLEAGDDRASFYAGAAEIALYRTETGHYRDNLNSGRPSLWVSLRPTGVEPPFEIVAVTADPAEGESFTQAGDDLVEAVPMPPAVRTTVEAFVAEHHVERPFVKRKRERADPEALARRAPLAKDRRR
jgi:Protein of unknown function (DUF3305)